MKIDCQSVVLELLGTDCYESIRMFIALETFSSRILVRLLVYRKAMPPYFFAQRGAKYVQFPPQFGIANELASHVRAQSLLPIREREDVRRSALKHAVSPAASLHTAARGRARIELSQRKTFRTRLFGTQPAGGAQSPGSGPWRVMDP